ncbi:MAG: integrase core domain-containing protein, partial [Leptospiraceae bacterium]|nr:integrase core domain-containing protein [Leptospiraceae bacterium]
MTVKHSLSWPGLGSILKALNPYLIWLSIMLLLIWHQRSLYLQNLLLRAQLQLYHRQLNRWQRRSAITEWFRRLCVILAHFSRILRIPWQQYIHIVSPATLKRWYDKRYARWWSRVSRNPERIPGKPPLSMAEIELIRKLACENVNWQPSQVAGQFYQLTGRRIHRDTVRKYWPSRDPDPLKVLQWKQFLKLHALDIAAIDFFTLKRWGFSPLYCFFVIRYNRRELLHINVTAHPTSDWIKEQLLIAFGTDSGMQYLLSDNDILFRQITEFASEILGLRQIHTRLASPWQSGVAERFVRTIREDLINYMIPLSETVIRQRLLEYRLYYNEVRTHTTLKQERPVQESLPTQ